MHDLRSMCLMVALVAALPVAAGAAEPQSPGRSKIICWKDKAGKVVGCGDKVPPEYQDSATRELSARGVTMKETEAALTAEQRKSQQVEAERKKAEAAKLEEQRRQDAAILATYTNEKEVDLKRRRDVQQIEAGLDMLQNSLKSANERRTEAQSRIEQHRKNKQQVPPAVQDEFDRAERDKARIENQIAQRRKDIVALNQKYDEVKKRYLELTGGSAAPASAAAGKK